MAHYDGYYFGYVSYITFVPGAVELPAAVPIISALPLLQMGMRGARLPAEDKKINRYINWQILTEQERPGYIWKVFRDDAPDDFQTDYFDFGFVSRFIVFVVHDNPADIILNLYGTDPLVRIDEGFGFLDLVNAKGFKIRNHYPGRIARYQMTVIN
jgi:hypothetical protein